MIANLELFPSVYLFESKHFDSEVKGLCQVTFEYFLVNVCFNNKISKFKLTLLDIDVNLLVSCILYALLDGFQLLF